MFSMTNFSLIKAKKVVTKGYRRLYIEKTCKSQKKNQEVKKSRKKPGTISKMSKTIRTLLAGQKQFM